MIKMGQTGVGGFDQMSRLLDLFANPEKAKSQLAELQDSIGNYDAVVSLACGAGVQSVSAANEKRAIAGLDTLFLGNIRRLGQFEQKCSLCGECILTETAGICPVTVCPKGLLNGPCGGMQEGRCETDHEADCAWLQIYQRLQNQGKVENLREFVAQKDFSKMLKPGKIKTDK